MERDDYWFRPKTLGYGAGLPIHWKGWATLIVHVGLIAAVAFALEGRPAALAVGVIFVALLPMPLYAAKTKGGWRWRWGARD